MKFYVPASFMRGTVQFICKFAGTATHQDINIKMYSPRILRCFETVTSPANKALVALFLT